MTTVFLGPSLPLHTDKGRPSASLETPPTV